MKTVLITGSGKGLGKELALAFAQNEFNTIIHGRDRQALKSIRDSILNYNVECEIIVGDITLKETIVQMYEIADQKNLDILVNNAGIYQNAPFMDISNEEFRRVIEVNLIAPILLVKSIFPIFQRKKSGLIININSIAGKTASDGESSYCASKHGLRGFSRSLQFDANREGIRVIDIYLGGMNTNMVRGRIDPEKAIQPIDAADMIVNMYKEYQSMRITEIELYRRRY